MRQIIALAGRNLSPEHHRHLLGSTIGEVEIKLARLYLQEFARTIELRKNLLLDISYRNHTLSLCFICIVVKLEIKRTESIGYQGESLITHRNTHSIRQISCYHRITWCSHQAHRNLIFPLHGLIERHHQPEGATESEKE